jgi:putative membrane protein
VLSVHAALTAWTVDPVGIAVVALGAIWYGRAVLRVRRRSSWRAGRCVLFGVGLLLLLYATCGWFGAYAHVFLWAYTAQVMVLLVVAPVLLLLGRPLSLVRSLDDGSGSSSLVVRAADSRLVAALSHPAVGPVLLPLATGLLFFSSVLVWVQASRPVFAGAQVVLLVLGLVMALGITGEGAAVSSMTMAAVVLCAFLELLADAVPGIAMRLRDTVLAPTHYLEVARGGGPSPLNDLHLAGSILWFVAETIDLPVLAILVVVWIRADEREARAIDRRLDAAAPALEDGELAPPWWTTDAQVFGSRRAAELHERR